ncbi:22982_t:CDS:1, partial [Racocetra persica]
NGRRLFEWYLRFAVNYDSDGLNNIGDCDRYEIDEKLADNDGANRTDSGTNLVGRCYQNKIDV